MYIVYSITIHTLHANWYNQGLSPKFHNLISKINFNRDNDDFGYFATYDNQVLGYFATYDNVTIGADGTLKSLGNYHGTVGKLL